MPSCRLTLTNECIIRDRIPECIFFYLPVALLLMMFPFLLLKKKVVSLFLARPAQKTTAQQLVLDESDRENVAVIHPFPDNIVKRMLCQYCNYSITVFMNYDTAITTCFHPPSLLSLADVVAFSLVVVLVRW